MKKIEELVHQAHKLWREGRESEMLPYLKEAISLCEKGNHISKQIELLNEYAGGLRLQGHYNEAIQSIDQALSLIDRYYRGDQLGYATTLMNKGNIYREKKDYFTAEEIMLEAKKIFEKIHDTSYSYVGLLNNLSLVYKETKNYSSAEKLQLEAIKLLQMDPNHKVPLAISYNNLYDIQKKLNRFKNAEENLKKAQDLLLLEVGENHPLYSAVLNNLAEIKVKNKDYLSALELYTKALNIVKICYGTSSDAYASVKGNLEYVKDLISTLEVKETDTSTQNPVSEKKIPLHKTSPLMDLARTFSKEVESIIYIHYPEIKNRICLALVGSGSECLYFDDELSKDHDYDIRCQLFLSKEDYIAYFTPLNQIFKEKASHKVIIENIDTFYTYYTSYPQGPSTISEFRQVPEEYLCTASNGEVFLDSLGTFSKIRKRLLDYYPQDLIYKRLAYHLNNIAQSGQYNYSRLLKRGDSIASLLALSEFMKHYMQVVHILNKKYMPFYKWSFKNLENMNLLGKYTQEHLLLLEKASTKEKEQNIHAMCQKLVEVLNQEKLTRSTIDFLTYQANEVTQNISDPQLRREDNWTK